MTGFKEIMADDGCHIWLKTLEVSDTLRFLPKNTIRKAIPTFPVPPTISAVTATNPAAVRVLEKSQKADEHDDIEDFLYVNWLFAALIADHESEHSLSPLALWLAMSSLIGLACLLQHAGRCSFLKCARTVKKT